MLKKKTTKEGGRRWKNIENKKELEFGMAGKKEGEEDVVRDAI